MLLIGLSCYFEANFEVIPVLLFSLVLSLCDIFYTFSNYANKEVVIS